MIINHCLINVMSINNLKVLNYLSKLRIILKINLARFNKR